MSSISTQDLPFWQLSSIFPGLDSAEYTQAKHELKSRLEAFEDFVSVHKIASGLRQSLNPELLKQFEWLIFEFNTLSEHIADLRAYLTGFISTDAFNDQAKAESSELIDIQSRFLSLSKRLTAFVGRLELAELLEASAVAREHAFSLERAQQLAKHLMPDESETLASLLDTTAGSAWARLHSDLVSKSSIKLSLPKQAEAECSLAELRNLQSDACGETRKAAFEAELRLLSQHEVAFAAAMNSIKGQASKLAQARAWTSTLEESLFQNTISQASLDAMQEACRESFGSFRRYLKAKAGFLGKESLAWYDLNAPVVQASKHYSYSQAQDLIIESFSGYSTELAAYAQKAFSQNWLDLPPRKGKRNGAFCMSVPGRKESRILLNYGHTLDDIFTLAHELGHGYHNEQMYAFKRSSLQRSTPMTLAETASIFCETIVVNKLLESASSELRLGILEQDLLGTTQLVVDIYSRFLFEKTVFEKRQERELSLAEFKGIMLDAQAQCYGDVLNSHERHPLMWAQKGHYYSSHRSFYNYPYTFGYLFALGLYAEYQQQPSGFHKRYNKLLASTGMHDAKTLARHFGIDIEDKAFWKQGLSLVETRVSDYEKLVAA